MQEGGREGRVFGLDLVRVAAVVFILGIHFFLNNGFYYQPMAGTAMWIASCFRWLFFSCVPIFLILTGYLKCHKPWGAGYYRSLLPVLLSWFLISLLCIAFKEFYLGPKQSLLLWLADFLDFKAANYAWYIEMYIGLFLISPFLNMAFAACGGRGQRKILVVTMIVITMLPSLLDRWEIPGTERTLNLIPNYWTALYPFTYYWIGCYLRYYQPDFPKAIVALLLIALTEGTATISYITAAGGKFSDGFDGGYSYLPVAGISVLMFLLLYHIKRKEGRLTRLAAHLSRISLEIYLVSWIFDKIFYAGAGTLSPDAYGWCFLTLTGRSFLCAALAATVIHWMTGQIIRAVSQAGSRMRLRVRGGCL